MTVSLVSISVCMRSTNGLITKLAIKIQCSQYHSAQTNVFSILTAWFETVLVNREPAATIVMILQLATSRNTWV
jgi:hypothetical protein